MSFSREVTVTVEDIKKGYIIRGSARIPIRYMYYCNYQNAIIGECTNTYYNYKITGLSDRLVEVFKGKPQAISSCCGVHLVKLPDTSAFDNVEKEFTFTLFKTMLDADNAGLKMAFVKQGDNIDDLVKLGFKKNRELKGGTIEYIYPTNHYSGC